MSDGTSFTIDIPVKGESAVDAAASAVDHLENSLDKTTKAHERLGLAAERMRDKLKVASDLGDTKGAAKAAANLRLFVDKQAAAGAKADEIKGKLKEAASAFDKLKGSAEKADGEVPLAKLGRGLRKLGGPLAEIGEVGIRFGEGWEKVKASLGTTGAIAAATVVVVALAAAVLELTKKVIESVIEIGKFGVEMSEANNHALLLAQGMLRSVKGGEALNDKINFLNSRLPLAREEIAGMAQNLAMAGYRGTALATALQNAGIRAARLKFGPDFEKEMLSTEQQSKVFKANLQSVFGGLKIEGLLKALQTLVSLLDTSTASGNAIKVVFESLFQPLIDGLAGAGPKIENFFLQLEILALKALIGIKPYGSVILKVVEAFVVGAAVIIGVVVVAFGLLAAGILTVVVLVGALAAGFVWLAGVGLQAGADIQEFFDKFSLADIGKAMIEGLANGIAGAGGAVLDALTGVVTKAVDAAKKALGIASPSKVFAEIGANTSAGMAQGVDSGSPGVKDSMERMASPPDVQAGAAPAPATAASSSGSFAGATFIFNGVEGAEAAESRFRELLTRAMEGDAAQLGAAQVAA